jgi:hypothetical protein
MKSDALRRSLGLGFNNTQMVCRTSNEVIESVTQKLLDSERKNACILPWFSSDEICHIHEKYSTIILNGDSFTRHIAMAIRMLILEDLRFGGYPVRGRSADFVTYCGCDGQFSEAQDCRYYSFDYDHAFLEGLCTHLPSFRPFRFLYYDLKPTFQPMHLCNNDPRPQFVFLSGGFHYESNPEKTIEKFLVPAMKSLSDIKNDCSRRLNKTQTIHVAFTGIPIISESIQQIYSNERTENAIRFHHVLEEYIRTHYPDVTVINFLNLTAEGVNRTSDGVHSLTDVNVMKAMTLLSIMNFSATSSSTVA